MISLLMTLEFLGDSLSVLTLGPVHLFCFARALGSIGSVKIPFDIQLLG